jgi:O-antigen/teichoic acid export membrane protein
LRIQEHIDKISWSFADKILFFIYGLVTLFQMRALEPSEWGLFGLMISLHTWCYIIIDSFALQGLIQFGMNEENKKLVNTYALVLQFCLAIIFSAFVFLFRYEFARILNDSGFVKIGIVLPILLFLALPRTYVIKLIYRILDFKKLFIINGCFFGVMILLTVYYLITLEQLSFNNMIYIYFWGTGLSSLLAIIMFRKSLKFSFNGNLKFMKYIKFTLPWTIYSGLNYLPRTIDLYIVQYFFNTDATGIYYSAKNLFRVFDETLNASYGLVYPACVRQIEKKNYNALNDIITKSVSFLLVAFTIIVIILELGGSEFLIKLFLPESYHAAIGQFNLLLIAAIGMPFLLLYTTITALGKPQVVMVFAGISLIFSVISLYVVSVLGRADLIPLGLIVYIFVNAISGMIYMSRNYGFNLKSIFRAVGDTRAYLLTLIKK